MQGNISTGGAQVSPIFYIKKLSSMKNLFAVITFCFLTITFSILWLAVLIQIEQNNSFIKYFAVAFVCSCLSFLLYLKLDNRKK